MKLDRLLAKHEGMGRTSALRLIAARRVCVDGAVVADGHHPVDRFSRVELDGAPLRPQVDGLYLMLHKPPGWLSATSDPVHPTVIDLIDHPQRQALHLAGRLDRASSGLMLLTNDGRWSRHITDSGIAKRYLVHTREPLKPEDILAFAAGFHFPTEGITTLPATLEIVAECLARVTLQEGRYHQIKRMFHRVGNRVTALHRESIGGLALPADLAPGEWRLLAPAEQALVG